MKYLLATMIIAFSLAGLVILFISLREFLRRIVLCGRFERAQGTIVSVVRKRYSGSNRHRSKPMMMNFPRVTFQTQEGKELTFTSETGDTGDSSRYVEGKTLTVVYDPGGAFPPMEDSWTGIWLPNLMGILAGSVFIFGAYLAYWAFGDRFMS